MHNLTISQQSLAQAQFNPEEGDVRACLSSTSTLKVFHIDVGDSHGQARQPSRVEVIIVGEILLTEEGGDLMLQVAHREHHCSATQPRNPNNSRGSVVRHVHGPGKVQGVLLYTLQHGIRDALPSGDDVQRYQLEEFDTIVDQN